MTPFRLRTLLAGTFAVVAFIATLAAFVFALSATHSAIDDWSADRTDEAASAAAIAVTEARGTSGWTPAARERLARILALTGFDVRVVSSAGDVIIETAPNRPGSERPIAERALPDGDERLLVYAIGRGDGQSAEEIASHLDGIHLVAALAAAVLASLIGLFAANLLARPLRQLADLAPALSRGGSVTPEVPHGGPYEVRKLASALTSLSDDLDRQRRSRVQLAEDLAHEIRTPLTIAQGRLEAMEDGVLPLDQEGVVAARSEIVRLGRLVGEIERLADAEVRPRRFDLRPLDLGDVAREHAAALAGSAHAALLELKPAPVLADADGVAQIVTNLVANAVRHGPEEGRITFRTGTIGRSGFLVVADEGNGIDDRDAIFRRFHRGPSAIGSGTPGFGLGLAIARDLAEAMGGTLMLDANEPHTAFRLVLPTATAGTTQTDSLHT